MTTADHFSDRLRERVSPIPGPIDAAPHVPRRLAQSMMDVALDGVDLGLFDLYVLRVVRGMDPFQVATMASILERIRTAGRAGADVPAEVTAFLGPPPNPLGERRGHPPRS